MAKQHQTSSESPQAALYYPYIHVRSEHWLKAVLLCMPVVKRIVPDTYTPEDKPNITRYSHTHGPYGPLLQSVSPYTQAGVSAQSRLLKVLTANESAIIAHYHRRVS